MRIYLRIALELGGYTNEEMHFSDEMTVTQDCWVSYDEKGSKVSLKHSDHSENVQKLLPDLDKSEKLMYTLSPKTLLQQYLDLCDSIIDSLRSLPPKEVIEIVSNFVVSDVLNDQVKLFPKGYIKSLNKNADTAVILRRLFLYSSWYDYSFVEELVKECNYSEGVNLLEWFYCHIDKTLPISYYPLPTPSALMIPDKSSSHFIMAMKYTEKPFNLSCIIALKTFLLQVFEINSYACLLLAIVNPDILYWFLPNSVFTIVCQKILEHIDYLGTKGIVEVAITPDIAFSKSGMQKLESISYFSFEDNEVSIVSLCVQ